MEALGRFLPRQAETHAQALGELRSGRKLTHWIWWELPQLRSLGRSQRAYDYGLADLDEATQYLAHPILGPRLIEMCSALMTHTDKSALDILGPIDALKLRSTATLFARVPEAPEVFQALLDQFFEGSVCPLTQAELDGSLQG